MNPLYRGLFLHSKVTILPADAKFDGEKDLSYPCRNYVNKNSVIQLAQQIGKKPENVILASEARPESASCITKCMFSSGCASWKGFRASRNDVFFIAVTKSNYSLTESTGKPK